MRTLVSFGEPAPSNKASDFLRRSVYDTGYLDPLILLFSHVVHAGSSGNEIKAEPSFGKGTPPKAPLRGDVDTGEANGRS